jgi:transposase
MASKIVLEQSVVIAVDPHKASWTAAAVSPALAPLATMTVPVGPQGYRQLRRFAVRWSQVVWAIEGAGGPGGPLVTRLAGDGIAAVDVPAKLAARVRMLSTGHGRTNDTADAISVGVAALTASGLRSAAVDQAIVVLRALIEHRDDVVRNRTQLINRLRVLLVQLVPGGVQARLTVDKAPRCCADCVPATGARTLRRRSISSPRSATSTGASRPGTATSPQRLLRLAARWSSYAASARCWRPRSCPESATSIGSARPQRSPPSTERRRSRCPPAELSATGFREPGTANSTAACTSWPLLSSATTATVAVTTCARRAEGKSHKEALRCLKRRLSDLVYRSNAAIVRPLGRPPEVQLLRERDRELQGTQLHGPSKSWTCWLLQGRHRSVLWVRAARAAAVICWYPVHRQRFSASASVRSSSVASGLWRRVATVHRTCPARQNPHWNALWSQNSCWTGWRVSSSASPSSVSIARPAARPAGTRQDL